MDSEGCRKVYIDETEENRKIRLFPEPHMLSFQSLCSESSITVSIPRTAIRRYGTISERGGTRKFVIEVGRRCVLGEATISFHHPDMDTVDLWFRRRISASFERKVMSTGATAARKEFSQRAASFPTNERNPSSSNDSSSNSNSPNSSIRTKNSLSSPTMILAVPHFTGSTIRHSSGAKAKVVDPPPSISAADKTKSGSKRSMMMSLFRRSRGNLEEEKNKKGKDKGPVPVGDDESNYDTLYDDIDECEEDEGDYDNVESEDEDEDEDEEEEDSRAVKSCSWMFSSGKEEISGEVEEVEEEGGTKWHQRPFAQTEYDVGAIEVEELVSDNTESVGAASANTSSVIVNDDIYSIPEKKT